MAQHDRARELITEDQLKEFRKTMEEGFAAINLRIDHVIGRHDITWDAPGCDACEVRRAG